MKCQIISVFYIKVYLQRLRRLIETLSKTSAMFSVTESGACFLNCIVQVEFQKRPTQMIQQHFSFVLHAKYGYLILLSEGKTYGIYQNSRPNQTNHQRLNHRTWNESGPNHELLVWLQTLRYEFRSFKVVGLKLNNFTSLFEQYIIGFTAELVQPSQIEILKHILNEFQFTT